MYRFMNDDEWRIKWVLGMVAVLLAILGIWYIAVYRRTIHGKVVAISWELKIDRLQYQTVDENDWYVPNGGRVYTTRWEFHHTERYVSGHHTETYTDRQSYSCGTSNKPKTCYRSVTKTRTVTDYSTRSIYKTKYYYLIDRWMNIEPLITSGTDKEDVHWPNTEDGNYNTADVIGNVKLGTHYSHYQVIIVAEDKTYPIDMVEATWRTYGIGTGAKLTLNFFGGIVNVEKEGWQ